MGSGEDAQFVFAKYDYTAQGNQVRGCICINRQQQILKMVSITEFILKLNRNDFYDFL